MDKCKVEGSSSSRPEWNSLEAFVREQVQQLIQAVLEEEVTELLGRRKSERRRLDAEGYRNGHGKPRKVALTCGTISVRRPLVRGLDEPFRSKVLPLFVRKTNEVAALEAVVTLLAGVDDAVAAGCECAHGSTCTFAHVAVARSGIALLTSIQNAISTVCHPAVGAAGIGRHIIVGAAGVAGFVGVDDAVAAACASAVGAAGVSHIVGVALTGITRFTVIDDAIATARPTAIGATRIGDGGAVLQPVVAFFAPPKCAIAADRADARVSDALGERGDTGEARRAIVGARTGERGFALDGSLEAGHQGQEGCTRRAERRDSNAGEGNPHRCTPGGTLKVVHHRMRRAPDDHRLRGRSDG